MYERTIETSEEPEVIVRECTGNLTVRGADEPRIILMVQDGEDGVQLKQEGEAIFLSVAGSCTLICPERATLSVERGLGNVQVQGVEGAIRARVVHGNATVRAVGAVTLDKILGNLSARDVLGDLEADEVKGNALARNVAGWLRLADVGGNLTAQGLEGGLTAGTVGGNVSLGPPFSPDTGYRMETNGNLTVRVPAGASLRVAATALGTVQSTVPGLDLHGEGGKFTGSLGDGQAMLDASVRGNLSFRLMDRESVAADAEDDHLSAQIEWRVNQALAEMENRLEASLGRVNDEALRHRIERAAEKARRAAERAAEQARMRAERAERRWRRASGRPSRPRETVTDEERLRVLRMVEDGRITPEEASELLTAMEGA